MLNVLSTTGMNEPIVITGVGIVSPIGIGTPEFYEAIYAGRSGLGNSAMFGNGTVAAEVRDFQPQRWLGTKGIRVLDRSARLLSVAAHLALKSSNTVIVTEVGDPDVGLVCGTMFGSLHSITSFDLSGLTDGPNYVNPMEFPNTVINSAAGHTAIRFGLRGVTATICAGLASGLHAIAYAENSLRMGRARMLLAGGYDELCEESFVGFRKTGVSSPTNALRPFAPDRNGTVPGEACALCTLETGSNARRRSVTATSSIAGFGASHDAYRIDRFQLGADGAILALRQALQNAQIKPEDVACIIASASGSRIADEMEARALRSVFGSHLERIPACAPKAALGECMGAAGALGVALASFALTRQVLPPTMGFVCTEFGLRLSQQPQPLEGECALITAFSCDGNNACMVLRRWQG
jgi:3-oxoacyl-[acyl-carrier-protein] synthase II